MQVCTHVAVLLFIVPQVLTLIAEENTTWTSKVAVSSPASSLDGQTCRDKDHDASSNGTNACPLGYYCSNGTCQCLTAPRGIVSCSEDSLYNYAVLDCYCATYNIEESLVQAGKCIFKCGNYTKENSGELYHPLPQNGVILNKTECADMNRTGALCGRCQDNHYPLAYSFSLVCVQCHHIHWNWARYIMAAYLPLTLFYLIVLFLKVNVVSGHLHHVVFFSQVMSAPTLSCIMYQSVQKRPGTRDYRYFSIGYILFRYFAFLLYGITLDETYNPLLGLLTLLTALVLVLTQPYKKAVSHYIKTNRAFLILYAMFYFATYGANVASLKAYNFIHFFYIVAFSLSLFQLLCILVLMLHSVLLRWRFFIDLGHSIRSLHRGYTAMDEDPEDGYCDRIVNTHAYPNTPGRHMENCSSLSTR